VEFITQGAETELDKNIIDQLTDPLMHLIRNCIDHGIESPEERLAKGKSETGTIKLTASNNGNHIFITVEDDGEGINTNIIRKKALEKGLISASDVLSEKETIDMIFRPGFSTAQNLTEVSGRGVGMDVVKRRINELRGEIIVDSSFGQGTRFTLKLQQSLSIVDSLLFRVGDSCFTIPVCDIEICDQVKASVIEENQHTSTLPYRDEMIYFSDLRQLLNIGGAYETSARMIIVRNGGSRIALIADQIIGEHQAVLKPLGKSFNNQQFLTSASQLGDGNIAFMLDVNAVIKNAYQIAA
jgi:two-component system chemotaxis sensor kinase CheA